MVVEEVAVERHFTSIHLECASITMRNILPKNGPAKSEWSRSQGHQETPKDVMELVVGCVVSFDTHHMTSLFLQPAGQCQATRQKNEPVLSFDYSLGDFCVTSIPFCGGNNYTISLKQTSIVHRQLIPILVVGRDHFFTALWSSM